MATAKKTKEPARRVTKEKANASPSIVMQQLVLRNIDRTQKDIGDWRLGHRMAEAIQNPTRGKLLDLFEDVILDGTLKGIWKKRVRFVTSKKLIFKKAGVKDDSFDTLTRSKAFKRLRKKRMDEYSYGIVGLEFPAGPKFNWVEIKRKHIRPEKGLITKEQDGYTGWEYDKMENVIVLQGEDEFGFLLNAAPYVIMKKGNYADWAEFIEIFGQPVIITKYDGYDEQTRALLESALENAGSSLRLMLPKQSEFEMLDGKTSNGDGRLQETFKNALNNEIMVLVLGNTETTSNQDGGSFAKGKVHADQQLQITADDMEDELQFFNDDKMLSIFKSYGFNTDGGEWAYEDDVNVEALKTELEIDEKLSKIGLPLDHDYYYEKYNRPKPANYDQLMAERAARKPVPPSNDPDDVDNDADPDDTQDPKDDKKTEEKMTAAIIKNLGFLQKIKALFQ